MTSLHNSTCPACTLRHKHSIRPETRRTMLRDFEVLTTYDRDVLQFEDGLDYSLPVV
jgi:hypothetical protein